MNKLLQSLSALGVSATLVTPNLNAEATTNTEPQLKGVNDIVIEKDKNIIYLKAYDVKKTAILLIKSKLMVKLIHPKQVSIK